LKGHTVIKRLTCTVAALAALIWTGPRAGAEYFDAGPIVRSMPFAANVDNSASGTTMIIVRYVGPKLDELGGRRTEEIEIAKTPPGQRMSVNFARPGKGVRLVIVEIETSPGGVVSIEIRQPALSVAHAVQGHGRMVLEVAGPEQ
jgi:hypothetical protein